MWKHIRQLIFVLVFAWVVFEQWQEQKALDWHKPFYVTVYPIAMDHTPTVQGYIQQLKTEDFLVVEDYFSTQAKRFNLSLNRPISVRLGEHVSEAPPEPPSLDATTFDIMVWSLKFRWFAWFHPGLMQASSDIKLYLLYFDPNLHTTLEHSTALNNGRIGLVNVYAKPEQHERNTVVLAHELLHTVNATDKYDLKSKLPIYPQGYAEPYRDPIYPQKQAEIMAGRVPIKAYRAEMAKNLSATLVGNQTAREIGWMK